MKLKDLEALHHSYKETRISGRYITSEMISPMISELSSLKLVSLLGYSVEERPIHAIKIGSGEAKVLLWSQMHGNESTTTKALFDLLNVFVNTDSLNFILKACTLFIIPMLNPDGALRYTRLNANGIDLNRDAQNLSQPESRLLKQAFNRFKPSYCFNLHGQRTIFGAGNSGNPATLSFLSPAQDANRTVTKTRKVAMSIIATVASQLQVSLPDAIGRYDDGFNINCVGDTFQSLGVPTLLFEAGHFGNDYARERARSYVFMSMVLALKAISVGVDASRYASYFDIPQNKKNFYDVIVRNAKLSEADTETFDIAIQFEEVLHQNDIVFKPFVRKIENLVQYFAHRQINANNNVVLAENYTVIKLGDEIDFVMLKNQKILIK